MVRTIIAVRSILLCAGALILAPPMSLAEGGPIQLRPGNAPKIVVYRQLFKHMEYLENKAKQVDLARADASPLRNYYKTIARLSDWEDYRLKEIAASTNAAVDALDQKAKVLIDAIRARHPDGKLATGEKLPEAPKELADMQTARNQLLQKAIEQVHAAFGDKRYQEFDTFVETKVSPKVSWIPVLVTPPQP